MARVSADTGFIVILPHSLYQMARRTFSLLGRMPAASNSDANRSHRSLPPPAASPRISLSACATSTALGAVRRQAA